MKEKIFEKLKRKLELLDREAAKHKRNYITKDDIEPVKKKCVFTTHKPVPAGHDKFPMDLVKQVLGPREEFDNLKEVFCHGNLLNMTYLALNLSHFINGVAKKHGEISKDLFAKYRIDYITNGVHINTWMSKPFKELLNGMVATIESGGDLKDYLRNKAMDAMNNYRLERKKYVQSFPEVTEVTILTADQVLSSFKERHKNQHGLGRPGNSVKEQGRHKKNDKKLR